MFDFFFEFKAGTRIASPTKHLPTGWGEGKEAEHAQTTLCDIAVFSLAK